MVRRNVAQVVTLPSYLAELVRDVEDRSGYPVMLSEESGIGYDSITSVAHAGQPHHSVSVVPEYRDHVLQFLTVGLLKVGRFYELPSEEPLPWRVSSWRPGSSASASSSRTVWTQTSTR